MKEMLTKSAGDHFTGSVTYSDVSPGYETNDIGGLRWEAKSDLQLAQSDLSLGMRIPG